MCSQNHAKPTEEINKQVIIYIFDCKIFSGNKKIEKRAKYGSPNGGQGKKQKGHKKITNNKIINAEMTILDKMLEAKDYTSKNPVSLIGSASIGLFLAIVAIAGWLFLENGLKRKHGADYVYELMHCNGLPKEEQQAAIEENYNKWAYKPHKFMWGLRALEEARKNKQGGKAFAIMQELIKMKSKSRVIQQLLSIEVAHQQMQQNMETKYHIKAVESISPKEATYELAQEAKLATLLERGLTEQYIKKASAEGARMNTDAGIRIKEIVKGAKLNVATSVKALSATPEQ